MAEFTALAPGMPAPYFTQRTSQNPRYVFDSAAGRYLVLLFHHSAASPAAQAGLNAAGLRPDLFNDRHASFFGVSTDPADEAESRVQHRMPGYRHFWDHDHAASRLYGATAREGQEMRQFWVIIDPTMRIVAIHPLTSEGNAAAIANIAALPPPARFAGFDLQAPILYLPRVFEPDLCRHLIDLYDAQGGEISGFMRNIDGKTVGVNDPNHKVRRDITISDEKLIATLQNRIIRKVVPEIAKIHMFHVTRMERYIVSCYDSTEGGHFAAHRDNTTPGTAHRRFAVSINLNDDFDGGEVSFPEYGPRSFKAPAGGAVVFSCALLHAVSRVSQGRRYAFLPFLYDEKAAQLRQANAATIVQAAEQANA